MFRVGAGDGIVRIRQGGAVKHRSNILAEIPDHRVGGKSSQDLNAAFLPEPRFSETELDPSADQELRVRVRIIEFVARLVIKPEALPD